MTELKTENKIKRIKKALELFEKYYRDKDALKRDYPEIWKEWNGYMQGFRYDNDATFVMNGSDEWFFEKFFDFMYRGWQRKPYKFKRLSDLK